MTSLGNSFLFYLRYHAEMNRLYWKPLYEGEQPSLDGLEDASRIQGMAHDVGIAASKEAAEFLTECGEKIEQHFNSLGCAELAKRATGPYMRKNWCWQAVVRKSGADGWFQCGVSIYEDERVVAPWIYRSGGRAWQQRVLSRLHPRLGARVAGPGTVRLGTVEIPVPGAEDEIDRDYLVASVASIFSAVQSDDVHALCVIEENEPDPESESASE